MITYVNKHGGCAPSPRAHPKSGLPDFGTVHGRSRINPTLAEVRGEGVPPRVVANAVTRGDPTHWLSFAAAPTFAVMALMTAAFGGTPDALCAALQGTSPLSGMVPMYLLMSAFHLAPWLKLIFNQRGA